MVSVTKCVLVTGAEATDVVDATILEVLVVEVVLVLRVDVVLVVEATCELVEPVEVEVDSLVEALVVGKPRIGLVDNILPGNVTPETRPGTRLFGIILGNGKVRPSSPVSDCPRPSRPKARR